MSLMLMEAFLELARGDGHLDAALVGFVTTSSPACSSDTAVVYRFGLGDEVCTKFHWMVRLLVSSGVTKEHCRWTVAPIVTFTYFWAELTDISSTHPVQTVNDSHDPELLNVTEVEKYVNVTMGATVHLQCSFVTPDDTSSLTIQWNFVQTSSPNPKQIYYYQAGEDVVTKPYQSRVQVPVSPGKSKNASISIRDMQPSDSGIYSCEVHNFPDVSGTSEVNIMVQVLEPPSMPFCAVHGDISAGHLVTLTCHSEKGSPTPSYSWIRLDQAKARQVVKGRVTPTGILQIRNISEFMFGEYQCNSSNWVGYSTCTVELSAEAEDGVIAGAVIGALLGCLLIGLVVWFIAHTVKKHRYAVVKAPAASETKGTSRPPPATSDVSMEMSSPRHAGHGDDDEHSTAVLRRGAFTELPYLLAGFASPHCFENGSQPGTMQVT
ncbi:hypothetical protein CRUP_004274 [Coryphaenoides rupestris]|nr:hypothetical protein CRUP_004274 [Coryphaenoides rupestris]